MLQALAHAANALASLLGACPMSEDEEVAGEVDRATHAYALLLDFESRQEKPLGYSDLFHLLGESDVDLVAAQVEDRHGLAMARRIRRTLEEHGFDAQAFSLACDRMDFSPMPTVPIAVAGWRILLMQKARGWWRRQRGRWRRLRLSPYFPQ